MYNGMSESCWHAYVALMQSPEACSLLLQGIEGSLQGLEDGQMQGMRRLAQNLTSAIEEAEASLQVASPGPIDCFQKTYPEVIFGEVMFGCDLQGALQADARRTMDTMQRLPALLAAALPVTDVTPLQTLADRPQPPPALTQIAPADRAWLQGVLEDALQQAAERVLVKQVFKSSDDSPDLDCHNGILMSVRSRRCDVSLQGCKLLFTVPPKLDLFVHCRMGQGLQCRHCWPTSNGMPWASVCVALNRACRYT